MVGAYLRIALRNFRKRRVFFLLNLMGLSVGLATFLTLYFYTGVQEQFDTFHEKADRIVRLKSSRYHKGVLSREMVDVCMAAGPEIAKAFPDVERYVRMVKAVSLIRYKEEWHKTEKACYASEDFFRIFSFPLLQGNDSLALRRPHTAVVSRSFARKVFGDEDPVGKTVNYKGRFDYEITGVFADMPANSHMDFDLILSFESYKIIVNKMVLDEPWRWDGFVTYLLLRPNVHAAVLEEKLPALIEERTGQWLRNTDQLMVFHLQPLCSIHLSSNFNGEWKRNGDGKLVVYLKLIAIGILLLAWINYVSLATAKSLERAREVGVRKVMGSGRVQLMIQFVSESILLNAVTLIVVILLLLAAHRYLPEYTVGYEQLHDLTAGQWIVLFLVLISGMLASSSYPALVLSGFNPVSALKGQGGAARGTQVRKVLVVVQFALSLILVIWIYIAGQQIRFLRSIPTGFDQSTKLIVRDSEVYDSLYSRAVEVFKKEVVRLPGVERMTYVETLPGEQIRAYANSVRRIKADTSDVNSYSFLRVDENFAEVLGLRMAAGRNFMETSTRLKEVLVNESATRQLGFASPEEVLQEEIYFRDDTVRIVGVLQDFFFHSPKDELKPLIFQYDPAAGYHYILKAATSSLQQVIQEVELLYRTLFPGQPFQYTFLDEHYEQQYRTDKQFERALLFFSGLSFWITCLGLVGMSAYTSTIRRKEIGIRKILGSTAYQVLLLLWKEYFFTVLIASIVAIPVAWYVTQVWLSDFSMRISLTPVLFVVPVFMLLLVTLLTVAIQTIRAAWANPVESLRHE